ncbi:MAG: ATP-dependent sacrificial sulfur transferase LarE [Actinomycetota bacterium]
MSDWREKGKRLREILESLPSAVVAYSGGVDSTLLAYSAFQALGGRMLAVLVTSPLVPPRETSRAIRLSGELGFPLHVVEADELSLPGFTENPRDRCYHCKKYRLGLIRPLAASRGLEVMLDGSNLDDASGHRPGRRATREEGCRSPLEEAEFTKSDVRALAREMGLPNWDAPSRPCLATRFPYGARLDPKLLCMVDEAEEFLEGLGLRELRVRMDEPGLARVEVAREDIDLLREPGMRERVARKFRGLGFRRVDLDLEGYRSGSMDREMPSRRVLIIYEDGHPTRLGVSTVKACSPSRDDMIKVDRADRPRPPEVEATGRSEE